MNPITPTVGRVVLVRSTNFETTGAEPDRDVPGLVTFVHSETCINVMVMRDGWDATPKCATSISYDDGSNPNAFATTWRWMDYQREQAAKHADPVPEPTLAELIPGPATWAGAAGHDYARENALGHAVNLLRDGPHATPADILEAARSFHAFMRPEEYHDEPEPA